MPVHPHSAVTLGHGTCLDKQNSQIKARREGGRGGGRGRAGGVIHLVKPVIAVESSRLIDIVTCSVSDAEWFAALSNSLELRKERSPDGATKRPTRPHQG